MTCSCLAAKKRRFPNSGKAIGNFDTPFKTVFMSGCPLAEPCPRVREGTCRRCRGLPAVLAALVIASTGRRLRPDARSNRQRARRPRRAGGGGWHRSRLRRPRSSDGQYPFQVALLKAEDLTADLKKGHESWFPGGTLIAPNWVLTAAHWYARWRPRHFPDAFVVLTGSTDLEGGQRANVKSVFVNEQYDENSMDHDVALVQLTAPGRGAARAIALDYDAAAPPQAVVLGWGGRTRTATSALSARNRS